MATLSSRLVISLLDRTGPGARSVVKNVALMKSANTGLGSAVTRSTDLMRSQGRTMRAFRTVGGSGAGIAGLGATALAGGFLSNELKYQEAMNRTKAILNVTDKEAFKPHRDLVVDLAKRYPTTSAEIAKGASELAMAGMSLKEVNEVLEATVQGSMASGETIKTVGMGVTDVIMGLGQALTKGNYNKVNDVLAAAATSYAQDYRQFLDGLAKTAPLARMLNMPLEHLAASLGILADAGFKGAKGGTAFRTSMINMAAPSKTALNFLQQAGVDITQYQKTVDTFQMKGKAGAQSLASFIADSINGDVEGANLDKVLEPILSDDKLLKDIPQLKRRLGRAIVDALNISDGEDSKAVGEAVSRFVQSGFKQLDVMGLMRELADKGFDQNTGAMKEMFGRRFVAQMSAVINSLRDGTFDKKMNGIFMPRIEGAVARFSKILMEGLPGSIKRLAGALDGFARSLAASGAIDVVADVFERLKNGLNQLSSTDPKALKAITLALLTLGVLAPVGFALQGAVAAITLLGGAAQIAAIAVVALGRAMIIGPAVAAWTALAASVGLIAARAKAARVAVASLMLMAKVGGMGAVGGAVAGSAFAGIAAGLLSIVKLGLRLTAVGAAISALVVGFQFVSNNWQGVKSGLQGIGDGFMNNLGSAKPIVVGISEAIQSIFRGLDRLGGHLGASKEEWKSWGEAIGSALAWPIRQLGWVLDGLGKIGSYLTDNAVGRWVGQQMGINVTGSRISAREAENQSMNKLATNPPAAQSVGAAIAKPAVSASSPNVAAVETQAQGAVNTVAQAMTRIESIASGVDLTSAGAKIMQSLAAGMRSTMGEPIAAMSETAQRIKNHVPQSPAKEGPLRGIHRHGLMSEIARGVRSDGSLVAAMQDASGRARAAVAGIGNARMASMSAAGGGAGRGGGGNSLGAINVHVNVPAGSGNPAAIGAAVGREVRNAAREYFSDGAF